MKIKNGMLVKVVYLPTYMDHFGHLGEVGRVKECTKTGNRFMLVWEDGSENGWWESINVKIFDLNKEERIAKLNKQIENLKNKIKEIEEEKLL